MILYAAARVLGCGSVQLTMVDEERKNLVFITSITNRELATLEAVEHALGFQLEGARMPLSNEASVVVRAMKEGRVIVTHDVAELAGVAVEPEAVEVIRGTIGPRSFGAVPIAGRAGALGVLIFEKPDDTGYTAEDRDLLVAYADRVGADLESQALSDDVRRLETLGPEGAKAPRIFSCDRDLAVATGPDAGQPLWDALGASELQVREALGRAAGGSATVSLRAQSGKLVRLTIAHGPGQAVIAAAEDLEETASLRREAERVREHLAKVLRSIGDVILTLDADGRVTSGNEAVARALGYQPEELAGWEALRLCADDRSRRRAGELRHQVRASGFAEGELRLRRKDGSTFAGAVSALALADDEERPAGMVWRVHDLTERQRGDAERKRLRARLLHTERLSALGEMAARIAHEVRNPLVSIGAAAQVVAEELPANSLVAGEVQAIAREVKRLDAIVSDFLRFARPRRPEIRSADLRTVVSESIDLVRAKAPQHELLVRVDGPLVARCDPDGVKQVLLNVLLNAVEATPSGVVECEARVLGADVVLSVTDRGPGIPNSARSRVFDPFFSTKTRGTGLGLAVSKQIVDEHRGRIRLLSRRGGGTRVVIELPVG